MSFRTPALRLIPILAIGAASAAIGAIGVSCSGGSGGGTTSQGGSGGTGVTTASGGAHSSSSGTGGDDIGFDAGTSSSSSTGGTDPDAGCAGEATKAVLLPLDMFIMLDRSGSMLEPVAGGGNKWDAIKSALQTFLTQPGLGTSGISVGIQYFGQPASSACPTTCSTDADCGLYGPCTAAHCASCGTATSSCFASDYATADVDIATLNNAQVIKLLTSINAQTPNTNTPTSAALQGAVDYCTAWAEDPAHANHVVVNVFATDGEPSECVQDQTTINGIAAGAANANPKILTFVIGVGSSLTKLNGIAAAGGTTKAFLIDTANPNTQTDFLAALNAIRGTALGCTYKIPQNDGGMTDLNKVNVQYLPGGGSTTEEFPKYQDAAHCPATGDGWYYDDNSNPTQILLCKNTCTKVGKDTMGEVNIVVGCQTKLPG